jgi:L-ascorbate metabolism protein UlaG (beta-lactamase superfamily)
VTAELTFIGTATTLLRLGEFTVLTDPNFLHPGQRAYLGYGIWSRRRTRPALDLAELPPLDAVVVSHLHGDHFDRIARAGLPRDLPIVSTRDAARTFRKWRFPHAEGLRTWASVEWTRGRQRLRVTAVPAQHGPALVHHLLPPTMGSILDLEEDGERRLRLYITGDTLHRPWLRTIRERFPDIDAMVIHLGGTRIAGVLLTMDGEQGARMTEMIGAGRTIPIHYDDYPVFKSPLSDYEREVAHRGLTGVRPIARGETIALSTVESPARRGGEHA